MAILKIARMGNPVLLRPADSVEDVTAPEIVGLANDMQETLEDIGANGLAASQVHEPLRIVVYRITARQIPTESKMKPLDWQVLVNPTVTALTEERKPIWERCLSVPGLHGKVPRFTKVGVSAVNLNGDAIDIEASGFHAMLLQHECDHLDGVLYPMRMSDLSTLAFNSELGDKGFFVARDVEEFPA